MNKKSFISLIHRRVLPTFILTSILIGYIFIYQSRSKDFLVIESVFKVIQKQLQLDDIGEVTFALNKILGSEYQSLILYRDGIRLISLPNESDVQSQENNLFFHKIKYKKNIDNIDYEMIVLKSEFGIYLLLVVFEFVYLIMLIYFMWLYAKILNKQHQAELLEQSARAMEDVAKQVSHDIRSPLAALNMMTKDLSEVPEDRRLIIRNSTQRINDIANTLLSTTQKKSSPNSKTTPDNQISKLSANQNLHIQNLQLKTEYLPAVVDALVSEKRVQYRELQNIKIELTSSHEYNQFVQLNQVEFKRVISNLINNSVEAFQNQTGVIQLNLRNRENQAIIEIRDNGKGIPTEIIEKLGTKGFSFGKQNQESGSGIGLYHAKNIVHLHRGEFDIKSQVGQGTTIRIILPLVKAPDWFVEKIEISENTTIVCIDDDQSIHQIWKNRFMRMMLDQHHLKYLSFTSNSEFKNWYDSDDVKHSRQQFLFLVDYEFLGQKQNGIEIIRELNIVKDSVLVTSRYDDELIQENCAKISLKIIPKTMAVDVPISFRAKRLKVDAILIDDDQLCIHPVWQSYAKDQNKNIVIFSTYEEFKNKCQLYSFDSPVFVDSNLGQNIKGEVVSQEIFKNGFHEIYLCTGYEPDQFPVMPWIRKILGKDPNF